MIEISRTWDSALHPRVQAGSAAGGQFAPLNSSGSSGKDGKGHGGKSTHVKDTRATPTNAHPVGRGERGQRVSDLQKRLNALGFKLKDDGVFGPETLAAVKAFQKAHGLKVDGLVGPKTTAALRQEAQPHPAHSAHHGTHHKAVSRTAHTAEASTVHEPFGSPSGPGLFHHKGLQLPAYIQHVAHRLVAQGHDESRAIEMAVGIVRNWAHGHDGHGNKVSGDVQAAAAKAMAQWEADKARAGKSETRRAAVTAGPEYDADGLDASWDGDNSDLPDMTGLGVPHMEAAERDSGVTPQSGGVSRAAKLGSGARFKKLSAELAAKGAHDPDALAAWIGKRKYGKEAFHALASKARRKGGGGGVSRSGDWRQLTRPFMVEDLHIMRAADGESSGRVVEGYAAVFNQPQPITDRQGSYQEIIDPHAFDAALARMSQRRGGIGAAVRVLFNHGKSIEGHPAPEFQKPIGRAQAIIPDSRGLLTRTEFNRTPLAEEVLELIRSGSITGMSFQGNDIRSDPPLRGPGDIYRKSGGALTTVRRMVLGLFEYSPVVFEAYPGAEFLGVVRMGSLDTYDDVTATDGGGFIPDEELPPIVEGGSTGYLPEDGFPSRSHAHRLWQMRTVELCRQAGIPLEEG